VTELGLLRPSVIRLHRLRRVEERPVMHETMVLPEERLPDFPRAAEDVSELLYRHLLERYGIRVSAVRESVQVVLASEKDGRLLELPLPAAVLLIRETAFDQAGGVVLLSNHWAVTTGYQYVNELS